MPGLISNGNRAACPCCGFGGNNNFIKSECATSFFPYNGKKIGTIDMKNPVYAFQCRKCGYIVGVPEDDFQNKVIWDRYHLPSGSSTTIKKTKKEDI